METKSRFISKVNKTDTCWLWTASKNIKGYGSFGVRTKGGKWKTCGAHRVSYELFVGKIPKGMFVLHKCDIPACVNPEHLWIGNDQDNCDDKHRKNRQACIKGEKNPCSILSEKQVRKIRSLHKSGKYRQNELSKIFKVSPSTVNHIILRIIWREVV